MKKVIALVGPTASGKTSLSLILADILNAEIVSADSRQIYRNIGIATCVPTAEERSRIIHHFIEELPLNRNYNAGMYSADARKRISQIFKKNKNVIIVGGSGLYLKALIDGLFRIEINNDPSIREKLIEKLNKKGKLELFEELKKIDPESASRMDYTKHRRVLRALEIYYQTGKKISELQKMNFAPDFDTIQIGIGRERVLLYKRINERVENMISAGLITEIQTLFDNNYHYSTHNSLNTVGIKEVMQFLEKQISYDDMNSKIKQNSRNYAKRQLTWFGKDNRIDWIKINERDEYGHIASLIARKYFK